MFSWWFSPKNPFSVIKIPVGIILGLFFISTLTTNFSNLIDAFRNNPLFTGLIMLILFPLIITFFPGAILWGGLFYLPYYVFEEEQEGWKELFKLIGILIGIVIILIGINLLAFGWTYTYF